MRSAGSVADRPTVWHYQAENAGPGSYLSRIAAEESEVLLQSLGTTCSGLSIGEAGYRSRKKGKNAVSLRTPPAWNQRLQRAFFGAFWLTLTCIGLMAAHRSDLRIGAVITVLIALNSAFRLVCRRWEQAAHFALKSLLGGVWMGRRPFSIEGFFWLVLLGW